MAMLSAVAALTSLFGSVRPHFSVTGLPTGRSFATTSESRCMTSTKHTQVCRSLAKQTDRAVILCCSAYKSHLVAVITGWCLFSENPDAPSNIP